MGTKETPQWIMWAIGVLVTIFMGVSGYSVYRVDKVAAELADTSKALDSKLDLAKDAFTRDMLSMKESSSKDFVTAREYGQLCRRLDNMEAKIDILLRRSR